MDDCKNAVNKGINTFGKIDILVSRSMSFKKLFRNR